MFRLIFSICLALISTGHLAAQSGSRAKEKTVSGEAAASSQRVFSAGFSGISLEPGEGASLEVMTPHGRPRVLDFTVHEGTEMGVDVSPDGKSLVFDLLGHIYKVPVTGGEALSLTQNSGVALNFHPRISHAGDKIVFVSDRSGQNNVWMMNSDGSNPRPVTLQETSRYFDPAWSPDGSAIVAVRADSSLNRGWHRRFNSIVWLPVNGAPARDLLVAEKEGRFEQFFAPSFSPDGKYVYFHSARMPYSGRAMYGANFRVRRVELASGKIDDVHPEILQPIAETPAEANAWDVHTDYKIYKKNDPPPEIRPEISPDGQLLAFARHLKDKEVSYAGHLYNHRTVLVIRNLKTGAERVLLDPIEKDNTDQHIVYQDVQLPRFGWSPDSRSIYLSLGGKIHRVNVSTGVTSEIPFSAHVHRVMSEQLHVRYDLGDDKEFRVRWLQWPSASPDKQNLVFVAAGKLWLQRLPAGRPQPLAESIQPAFALTPAWSPDGRRIAFTSWHDIDGGQVWLLDVATQALIRLSKEPGEYLHPVWSPDGKRIVVTHGTSGPPAARRGTKDWNGWHKEGAWQLLEFTLGQGETRIIASDVSPMQRSVFGSGGSVFYQAATDAETTKTFRWLFPSAEALQQRVQIKSLQPDGGTSAERFRFPARSPGFGGVVGNEPAVSPDGKFIAYNDVHKLFVQDVSRLQSGSGVPDVNTDPHAKVDGRRQADEFGGAYFSWLDSRTLQFFSGDKYVLYDAVSGTRSILAVDLRLPRDVPTGQMVLRGANIITANASQDVVTGDIVIDGARISCVGKCQYGPDVQVVDAQGKTIIPGLIDVHDHVLGDAVVISQHRSQSALPLAYGVTTHNDPAVASESLFSIAALVEAGSVVGPRSTGTAESVITRALAHGDFTDVLSAEDAYWNVRHRVDWGADRIKNYRQASRRAHQLLIDACRQIGCNMTAEGGSLLVDLGFAIDGQTGWEHDLIPMPVYDDVIQFLGRAGVCLSPTSLVASGESSGSWEYFGSRSKYIDDPKYRRFTSSDELEALRTRAPTQEPKLIYTFPIIAQGVADIIRAGGSGAIGEHGEMPGVGAHWEIWGYSEALKPLEAITMATRGGARFLGIDADTGSIEVGKLADLVVLNSDPLQDIHSTADIRYVMKAGNLYDADTLDRLWPTKKSFGPVPWLLAPAQR